MTTPEDRPSIRVVVADDDDFTRSLIADGLRTEGFEVLTAGFPDAAWDLVVQDAHVLVTDLDFGSGISAGPLLLRMAEERPWVAIVVLTSHVSPQLALSESHQLPAGVVYLVKSRLGSVHDVGQAIRDALAGRGTAHQTASDALTIPITAAQAGMLRMLASGYTTTAIAGLRGTTPRAAEAMIGRLYGALGVDVDAGTSSRTAAIRLWQQGRVRVR